MHNTISIKIIYWSLQNVSHRKPPCPRTSTQATSRDECSGESTSLTADLEQPAYVGQPDTSTSFTTPMKTPTPFTTPMKTNRDDHSYSISHAISSAVLSEIGHLDVFDELTEHMFDCPPDNDHVFTLIKSVAAAYVKIRMHHLTRRMNESISGALVRKKLTKLVLFKHQ